MKNREEIAKIFYIDDHAVVYGLLCKAADQLGGDMAYAINSRATVLYASERGQRMAKRAIEDGLPLDLPTYRAYTEWADDQRQMKVEIVQLNPNYRMKGTYCVWNEAWKKYGLERYGVIYCQYVDQTMVRAFNPENNLVIHAVQSHGGYGCDFEWPGLSFKDVDEMKAAAQYKQSKRDRTVKDFLYHCGHTVSSMGRSFSKDLGKELADTIISQALAEYAQLFGNEKAAAVVKESERDFSEI